MIKNIIKTLLITFSILVLIIFYLSIFGIKTDKFNHQISNNISKINKKINLKLSVVNYLLNPFNFTIKIKTNSPQIVLEDRNLDISRIKTNIALKNLINGQFSIVNLEIATNEIKLNDVIKLTRAFQNSPQLFILDSIIKDGHIIANINLNFDEQRKLKDNYKIEGIIKKGNLDILNQFKLNDLNFKFNIEKNIYLLNQIEAKINNIKIASPLIKIKKNKEFFSVSGKILNEKKNFDDKKLKLIFPNLLKDLDIKKIELSSKNDFSFNISNNFKLDNLKTKSTVNLNQLIINKKDLNLIKTYLPSFVEEIKLEKHEIVIK